MTMEKKSDRISAGALPSLPSWSPGESTPALEDITPHADRKNITTPIPRRTGDNRCQVSCGHYWGDSQMCLVSDSRGPMDRTLTSTPFQHTTDVAGRANPIRRRHLRSWRVSELCISLFRLTVSVDRYAGAAKSSPERSTANHMIFHRALITRESGLQGGEEPRRRARHLLCTRVIGKGICRWK
jgi:hypothetical protein